MPSCNCYDYSKVRLIETRQLEDINGDGAPETLEVYSAPKNLFTLFPDCCRQVPSSEISGIVRFGDPKEAGKFLKKNPTSFVRKSDGHRFQVGDKVSYNSESYTITALVARYEPSRAEVVLEAVIKSKNPEGFSDRVDIGKL